MNHQFPVRLPGGYFTYFTNKIKIHLRQVSFFIGTIVLCACSNHNAPATANNANPLFQSDPKLKSITEQITKSPKDADLYFQRGILLQKMQVDSLALNDYKTAIALDSSKAEYYSAIGDLLFEDRNITESVQWLKKAIAKNPTDRKAHLKIAKLFLYIKKYQDALDEINIVLRKDVYDPEAYFLKGMIYKDSRDTAKAISTFLTAEQVAPEYKDAIIQLGMLYSAKKDPVALSYFDKVFKLDSSDVFPLFAKGVFYQNNNNLEAAKEQYKECIVRNRHFADAYFNMGSIYMQQDSVAKAYKQYDIVTKIDPGNPTAYYDRGVCNERLDSIKQAVEDYKLASALDSTYKSPKEALQRLKVKS